MRANRVRKGFFSHTILHGLRVCDLQVGFFNYRFLDDPGNDDTDAKS